MTAPPACDCAAHTATPPVTVRGEHRYSLAEREEFEPTQAGWIRAWRWECLCGRRGRWQWQSDSAAFHAWERHAEKQS